MRTILKFGGTSVATPEALERLAAIVAATAGERAVVVSATAGTTNALLEAAGAAAAGDGPAAEAAMGDLRARHSALARAECLARLSLIHI